MISNLFDIVAEALGRPAARPAARPVPEPDAPVRFNLDRAGTSILNHQLTGVNAQVTRADSMFAALDRWLWKQRVRETEAWLATSKDLFELEARIRDLDRRPLNSLF